MPCVGCPGVWSSPDLYNTLNNEDWNITYGPTQPQQVHFSFASDTAYARFQFSTLASSPQSHLKYWPAERQDDPITVNTEDWTFVDGGAKHRPLYMHQATTKRLESGCKYQYQVGSQSPKTGSVEWSPIFEFHTASSSEEFEFLITGDLGVTKAVALPHLITAAQSHNYDFIVNVGDQGYDLADFEGIKGDQYMNMMQAVYGRLSYQGVQGNHEVTYDGSHYKNRFKMVPYEESGYKDPLVYSYNHKSIHFVFFSTELYMSDVYSDHEKELQEALAWLENDLSSVDRAKYPWIIFVTHHPIYCTAESKSCSKDGEMIRNGKTGKDGNRWGALEPILQKHKVDLYLSGHVHSYERTWPVSDNRATSMDYENPSSLVALIVGNAGEAEGNAEYNPAVAEEEFPDWKAFHYGGYGFSSVKVSPSSLEFTHTEAKLDGSLGRVIDQFTIHKEQDNEN
ncbi:isoform c [Lichtheimia corymbifera JMRC:FSU:9682]|uniref:Purple acid phosphatase n=1 Tax=Lichtheimia corymbifera JMRC:FSU:9682 TaxID=1263082 RepID=A0A068RF20_9FUNG|nr:isoform c [Lichtheimia corymbifera JMRC:FSU:9682]